MANCNQETKKTEGQPSDYLLSVAKVRSRKVDPLQFVIELIKNGQVKELKSILSSISSKLLDIFKERLMSPRVPQDYSPLVTAVLNDQFKVFSFLLENFPCNVEQETSVVIDGSYPIQGASPLWTSSTLGKLDFVKLLVSKGADIEHTTDSKSSPLRAAAFDGHCSVCEFLIGMGADIDKPNRVGQSPLTIAAARVKKECVELLIKKGADVNHKGYNGDTPLHLGVETGVVEIAKLLVEAGAKNKPNDFGFTPSIMASCYGRKEVVDYLQSTFELGGMELYNCFCLLYAKELLGSNSAVAKAYMKKAIEIRQLNKELSQLPPAHSIYNGLQEPATEAEVDRIFANKMEQFFVSSIYCERILGPVHPTTASYLRITGDIALVAKLYEKCMDLWHRSLDFDDATRMAYELKITKDLLFAIRGFSIMCDDGFIPPVEPHFLWGLKEFHMAHDSKISEASVVSCLFRMIAVWIKVVDHIEEKDKVAEEWVKIRSAVDKLVEAMEGSESEVLVACLQNLPEHRSSVEKDIIKLDLPLHRAIVVFLDQGCPIHCEDEHGNFPLHLAVKLQDVSAVKCVSTLLEYGAHYDAVNFKGETALDLAKDKHKFKKVLTHAAVSHLSLQCLACRSVVNYGLHHLGILPQRCLEFVAWHEGDKSISCDRGEFPHVGLPGIKLKTISIFRTEMQQSSKAKNIFNV